MYNVHSMYMRNFFLQGYLKAYVYKEKPRTLKELKAVVRNQTTLINDRLLGIVEEHFEKRARNVSL